MNRLTPGERAEVQRLKALHKLPYLPNNLTAEEIERVAYFITKLDIPNEFYLTKNFDVDQLTYFMRCGFLPMSIDPGEYLTPKLHLQRCIVEFSNLHITKNAKKRSKKYFLTINTNFDQVAAAIIAQHDHCWLYPNLLSLFKSLYNRCGGDNGGKGRVNNCSIVSVELWRDPEDEEERKEMEKVEEKEEKKEESEDAKKKNKKKKKKKRKSISIVGVIKDLEIIDKEEDEDGEDEDDKMEKEKTVEKEMEKGGEHDKERLKEENIDENEEGEKKEEAVEEGGEKKSNKKKKKKKKAKKEEELEGENEMEIEKVDVVDKDKMKEKNVQGIKKEGKNKRILVAGELGYIVGSVYCSLTGFAKESNAGTVQLAGLAALLVKGKFSFWDLGMTMDYKSDLGAASIPRAAFREKIMRVRDETNAVLECEGENVQTLIKDVIS